MTGICAIYSNFSQSRQPIISLTSTFIRGINEINVRHNSGLACARNTSNVLAAIRKSSLVSSFLPTKPFTRSLITVSAKYLINSFFYLHFIQSLCEFSIVLEKMKVNSIYRNYETI